MTVIAITSTSEALSKLGAVRHALAKCGDFAEVRELRNRAKWIRQFLKSAAEGLDLQNQAAIVKLLCERRAGEILIKTLRHGGDRRPGKHESQLKALGIDKAESRRLQMEASVSDEEFWQFVQQVTHERKEITSHRLIRFVQSRKEKTESAGDGENPLGRAANGLKRLARRGKRFACIYADPPWAGSREAGVGRMTERLCQLPVKAIATANAHLHLWVPPELVNDGMAILRAWGFRYKTQLVRHKLPPDYGKYWQTAHNVLLLGVRGQLAFHDTGLPSWLDGSDVFGNATAEIHTLILRASLPPYLDLFAERTIREWISPLST